MEIDSFESGSHVSNDIMIGGNACTRYSTQVQCRSKTIVKFVVRLGNEVGFKCTFLFYLLCSNSCWNFVINLFMIKSFVVRSL